MGRQEAMFNDHRLLFNIERVKSASVKKIIGIGFRTVADPQFRPQQIGAALGLPHVNQLVN